VCRAVPPCLWGSRGGGLERGLAGFLLSTPEAVGGSRSRLSQDFGLRLRAGSRSGPRGWQRAAGLTGLLYNRLISGGT
jgi:hypothetical protein